MPARRSVVRTLKFSALAVLVAVALFAAYLALVPTRLVEGAYLLLDVAAGTADSPLKSRTAYPSRTRVEYSVGEVDRRAVLYRPSGERPRAAIVLMPGATPDGADDPRLSAYAASLARARFLVLVPDEPSMRALQLNPADADIAADAVRYLVRRRAEDGFGTIGLHAVSYSAGPAVIAATYVDVRAHVGFLVVIGGYFSIVDSIRFLTTGHYRDPDDAADAPWRRRIPDSAMVWRFIRFNAEHAERPRDRIALAAIARVRLERPDADVSIFVSDLAPDARAIFDLADNRDPARVPALIDGLPVRLKEGLRGLDLSTLDLSGLRARLILVHGRDDPVIPPRESVRLAAAVPAGRAEVRLIDAITHASVGGFGLADGYRMWRTILSVLAVRDGG